MLNPGLNPHICACLWAKSIYKPHSKGDCNVSNPTVIAELENKVEERVTEISDIEAKIEKIENSRNDDRERFLRFALAFADDLGNGFFNLQPNQAKKCELLLFPNGFFVDADKKVHIPKISPFYRYRSTKKASKDAQNPLMVIPAGEIYFVNLRSRSA